MLENGCETEQMKKDNMQQTSVAIFFYGLHMDMETLRDKGVVALDPCVAYAKGFRIVLGRKAMLIESEGQRAAGVVCRMPEADIQRLYKGMLDYERIGLMVEAGNATITAVCMIHRAPRLSDPVDDHYANKLKEIYRRLELDANLLN